MAYRWNICLNCSKRNCVKCSLSSKPGSERIKNIINRVIRKIAPELEPTKA